MLDACIARAARRLFALLLFAATAAGISPVMAQGLHVPSGGSLSVPSGGSLGLACGDLSVDGQLAVGSGTVTGAGNVAIAASGTVQGGSGAIRFSGDWSNQGQFDAGGSTVYAEDGCATATTTFSGISVFHNLVLSSSSGREFSFPAGSQVTITGTLTLQGTSGQPVILSAYGGGTARIVLAPGATLQSSHAVIPPSVIIGDRPPASTIPTLGVPGLLGLVVLLMFAGLFRLGIASTRPRVAAKY